MRFLKAPLLLLVVAIGIATAQVPGEWDQWVAEGVVADDNSEYADAERLLGQACDLSIAGELGSERLTRACLLLAHTHSVQGRIRGSAELLGSLIDKLEQLPGARPANLVAVLLEMASVEGARARFRQAQSYVRQAIRLAEDLQPAEQAGMFIQAASLFLPANKEGQGHRFLTKALDAINSGNSLNDDNLRGSVAVGQALHNFERQEEAIVLLRPVVEYANQRALANPSAEAQWSEYRKAAVALIGALEISALHEEAAAVVRARRSWPQLVVPEVSADISPSRLEEGANVVYTPGARKRDVQGAVALSVEIWPDGKVHNISVVRSLPYGLTWQAIRALRLWRFHPAQKNGQAIKVRAQVDVRFRIDGVPSVPKYGQ